MKPNKKKSQFQPHFQEQLGLLPVTQYSKIATLEEGRDFGCPCGKFYLSNAALYTHVKIKHNGQAPGPFIKRSSQKSTPIFNFSNNLELRLQESRKTRGPRRGRIDKAPAFTNEIQEDSDCPFDTLEEASKLLTSIRVVTDYPFTKSKGDKTCQDMVSHFIEELSGLEPHLLKIVRYYVHLLKEFICSRKGNEYWYQKEPKEIVLQANQFTKSPVVDPQKCELSKDQVIELTYLFCRWMYRKKWTHHKLLKRTKSIVKAYE